MEYCADALRCYLVSHLMKTFLSFNAVSDCFAFLLGGKKKEDSRDYSVFCSVALSRDGGFWFVRFEVFFSNVEAISCLLLQKYLRTINFENLLFYLELKLQIIFNDSTMF